MACHVANFCKILSAYSIEMGATSQNPASYDYAETMRATGFNFIHDSPGV